MKLSTLETSNVNSEFAKIEQMKTYYPSEKEFSNPIAFIDSIMSSPAAQRVGCIKIVPPKSFRPGLAFDLESKKPLPTRYQVL